MEAECELDSSSAPGSYTRNSHLISNWGEDHVGSLYPISVKLLQLHHNSGHKCVFFWTAKIYNTWFSILSNTREYRVLLSALYSTVFLPRLCWKKKKKIVDGGTVFFSLKGRQKENANYGWRRRQKHTGCRWRESGEAWTAGVKHFRGAPPAGGGLRISRRRCERVQAGTQHSRRWFSRFIHHHGAGSRDGWERCWVWS